MSKESRHYAESRSSCPRWCGLEPGHDGLHQDHIARVVGQRRATASLTVEAASDSGNNRLPVLTVGNGTVSAVVLGWDELAALATAMHAAIERHSCASEDQ